MTSRETKAYRATLVAIFSELILLSSKGIVGFLISSLSVLADALDSLLDLIASTLIYFFLRQAARPPDEDHPFGHGKYDAVASLSQATLMLGLAGIIFYEAINKVLHNIPVKMPELGVGIMLINILFRISLVKYFSKIRRETGSLSIFSLIGHYKGDLYNSVGIILGLLVVRITDIHLFDPLIAFVISFFFLKTAVIIYREAFHQILDRVPEDVYEKVSDILREHYPELTGFHKLRIRKAGNGLQMDMHILLPNGLSLQEAHDLSEHLENDIKEVFPSSVIVIHMEPEVEDVKGNLESKKKR
ncbi:cation transporter [bacterium]|nr:cation transporter [bacterium]